MITRHAVTFVTRMDDDPAAFEHAVRAAALLSPAADGTDDCVAALDAAERGLLVSGTRQRGQNPQSAVEKTKKQIDKAVEELGGDPLKGLFGN